MKKLYVIDAVGFIFRAYHAIRYLTNSSGQSTGALYGFIQTVLKLIRDQNPDHIVAVFDGPDNKASRLAIYPEYKANRGPCPEDLYYQINWAQDFCRLYGIPELRVSGVEADDTMGSVAKWAESEGFQVFVCSADKDMAQVITERVHVLNVHTKDEKKAHLDPAQVESVYGVRPDQIIDWLALTGDSSDNVPGIPGCGPKTASKLLRKYGSIDEILKHTHEITGPKQRLAFEEHGHITELSRKLVTLDLSIDFPKEAAFFEFADQETKKLQDFYREMEFENLLRDIAVEQPKDEVPQAYTLVDDAESLATLLGRLRKSPTICFDTETTGIDPIQSELVGIGFCTGPGKAWYVPANGKLGLETVLKETKSLFEDSNLSFFAHNAKYDCHILANYDIHVRNIGFDTILASYLLNSHDRRHSLDHLTLEHFGKVKTPIETLIGKGAKQITMAEVPIEQVCDYCCEDVDYTWRLRELQLPKLRERQLDKLLLDLELPLSRLLERMERKGIHLDVEPLSELSQELHREIKRLETEIHQEAGYDFNLKSPKQLGEVLFVKMEIPAPKKTKTGFSTNAEVLELLCDDYPFVEKILHFRTLEKLRSTYVDTLPDDINPATDRIHCTFNQSVAATGRLSSQNPNLQNIPVRTDMGRRVREAFKPAKPGWSFLSADYSQIELRILAHMSEDPTLIRAFQNGEDIHATTAAHVFGVPLEDVSKVQRYHAKAVNFGILYGQQAFGLARELHVSREEAAGFIKLYFERFSRVKDFLEECREQARQTGRTVTLTGRERLIPEINSKNGQVRSAAERLAINTPLQGTAADLIKLAMLRAQASLDKAQMLSFMVLQIHDELIFEAPDHELLDLDHTVRDAMQKVWKLKVPLLVDVSIGKNWKEC